MAGRLDPVWMEVVFGDTNRTPASLADGSRAMSAAGSAHVVASEQILEKGKAIAGELLEACIEYSTDASAFTIGVTD